MINETQLSSRKVCGGLRLSRHTVGVILVLILIFMWSDGFALNIFNFSDDLNILKLIMMFALFGITIIFYLANPGNDAFSSVYGLSILGILSIALLTTFYYLVIGAGLSVIEVFRVNLLYPGLFSFFVLAICLNFNGAADITVRVISVTVFMYIVFLMIISVDRQLADMFVVRTSLRFDDTRITLREGLRLLGSLFFFLMVVKIGSARTAYQKAMYAGATLVFLTYLVTVNMSRRMIMLMLITTFVFVLFYGSAQRRFYYLSIVAILTALIWFTPIGEPIRIGIESSLSTSATEFEERGGTVGVRIEGIMFNMQIFADNGYFGIGNRSDRLPTTDPYFYGREIYRYFHGDHGFFGVMYRFGIIGTLVSLIIVNRIYWDTRFIRKYGSANHKEIALAVWLVFLFGFLSFDEMFWTQRYSAFYGLLFFLVWRMRRETVHSIVRARDFSLGTTG